MCTYMYRILRLMIWYYGYYLACFILLHHSERWVRNWLNEVSGRCVESCGIIARSRWLPRPLITITATEKVRITFLCHDSRRPSVLHQYFKHLENSLSNTSNSLIDQYLEGTLQTLQSAKDPVCVLTPDHHDAFCWFECALHMIVQLYMACIHVEAGIV